MLYCKKSLKKSKREEMINDIPFNKINFLPDDVATLIVAARRLELKMRGIPLASYLQGNNFAVYGLLSEELLTYRPYVPGDDPRDIDWRAFARTDRYFVASYRCQSARNILFALDTSSSMQYTGGASCFSKLDYARRLVAVLAAIAMQKSNRLLLMPLTENKPLLYGSNKGHFVKMLYELFAQSQHQSKNQQLTILFENVIKCGIKADTIFVISDFFHDATSELCEYFRKVASLNKDVFILHVLAEEELSFPFKDEITLRDMEEPSLCLTGTAELIKDKYLQNLQAFIRVLREECYKHKFEYAIFNTSMPIMPQLTSFLLKKKNHKWQPLFFRKKFFV